MTLYAAALFSTTSRRWFSIRNREYRIDSEVTDDGVMCTISALFLWYRSWLCFSLFDCVILI